MTADRDTTRIVRSWLEHGSTGIPDHVLDAAMAGVRSTPQRRRWSPWRFPRMHLFLRLGVVAAVVVLAVALGRQYVPFLSGVGGPGAAPSGDFGGRVTFTMDGTPSLLEIDAHADGLALSGTAVIETAAGTAKLNLACARHEGSTWMFAGTYSTPVRDLRVGENTALLVVDGSPQQVGWLQNSDLNPFAPCQQFAGELEALGNLPSEALLPVETGSITLPRAP